MSDINIGLTIGLAGTYRLRVLRPDGSVRIDTGEFKNIITTKGLDFYCANAVPFLSDRCRIGTGTTPVAATDTVMEAQVASTTTLVGTSHGMQSVSPGRWMRSGRTITFAIDQYIGTITEIGFDRFNLTNPDYLFSHAILPVPITLIPGDQLEATYTLYHLFPEDDWTKVININGVDHTITGRALALNSTSTEAGNSFWFHTYCWHGFQPDGSASALETDVLLPATALVPNGAASQPTTSTYTPGSFEIFRTARWRIQDANFPTGIGLVIMRSTRASGDWQFKFSPKIPKDATNMLTITWKFKFTRAVAP